MVVDLWFLLLYVFSLYTTVIDVFHAYSGFMSEITENLSARIHGTPKHQQYNIFYYTCLLLLYTNRRSHKSE